MAVLRWLVMGAAALTMTSACGGGDGESDTSAPTDTHVTPDTTPPADTGPETIFCCPLGNCGPHQDCVAGACLPAKSGAGSCYFDGECPQGATCEGETVCACGVETASCQGDPGTCRYPAGCCNGDGDCDAGEVCEAGQCRAPGTVGTCWRDSQCKPGEGCLEVTTCACGDDSCTDHIGYCGLPGICCQSDLECADSGSGGVCRGGRCVETAAELGGGACWGDDDCSGGDTCLGASLCPCSPGNSDDSACVVPSTAGRCGKAAEACCDADDDCGDGELCLEGRACVKAPNRATLKDECWVDAECGGGRVCEGATVCGCNEADCTAKIGHCRTLTIGCADDHTCPVGMECARPDTGYCPDDPTPPDGLCVKAIDRDEGACWATEDCPGNTRCGGETICTDVDGCDRPNLAGTCQERIRRWDCCDSHIECGEDMECRNNDASLTCPVGTGAICVPKPIFGEQCWNLYDCPEGKTCQKTNICGCNAKCRWNNMGNCEIPTFCDTDLDCGTDSVCAHDTECILSPCTTAVTCPIGGRCQLKQPERCWNHDECGPGQYCEGLRVCPADITCVAPDVPGTCQPRGALGDCCSSLRGCTPGLRCVSVTQRSGCGADFSAICVPAVTLGSECYVDNDCSTGQRCAGSIMCPCGVEDCTSPPTAGTCVINN